MDDDPFMDLVLDGLCDDPGNKEEASVMKKQRQKHQQAKLLKAKVAELTLPIKRKARAKAKPKAKPNRGTKKKPTMGMTAEQLALRKRTAKQGSKDAKPETEADKPGHETEEPDKETTELTLDDGEVPAILPPKRRRISQEVVCFV